MFSVRLKRKPDVFKFTRDALKLEYAMNVYQKFRDSKTGGPCYTLVWLSREAEKISFFPFASDVSFQRGFLISVKMRADLLSKKFRFSGRQVIQVSLVPLTET